MWPRLLKVLLESQRLWAAALALALLGGFTFVARRYGLIDDIPPTFYYVALGLGLFSGLFIVTTAAQNLTAHVRANRTADRKKKQKEEFARRNFLAASRHERAVLLHYKRQNTPRFRVVHEHSAFFYNMARQALLDHDSFDGSGRVQHYLIPDVVWKLLDDPPAGWADRVPAIGAAEWEH